jgi:Flp pilus assembly protein CpaB
MKPVPRAFVFAAILIAVVACCGGFFLGLTFGTNQANRTHEPQSVPPQTVHVVVAARNLPGGTLIDDPDTQLKKVSFLPDSLPPGAVTNPEDLRGKWLMRYLYQGTPISTEDLCIIGPLPFGKRAMAIRVGEGASPKILPGCYVDILAEVTDPKNTDPRRTFTKTIVERVMVLAWRFQAFDATLTIAVTKEQAEKLGALAGPEPFIVALRRPVECEHR